MRIVIVMYNKSMSLLVAFTLLVLEIYYVCKYILVYSQINI